MRPVDHDRTDYAYAEPPATTGHSRDVTAGSVVACTRRELS